MNSGGFLLVFLLILDGFSEGQARVVNDFIHFKPEQEPLNVGDTCNKTSNGANGVCTYFHQCNRAKADGSTAPEPEICFFDKLTPIVCCPSLQLDLRPDFASGRISRISAEKCITEGTVPSKEGLFRTTVVGGIEANIEDFPFMVGLAWPNVDDSDLSVRCGGTLISDRYVVTAAHCLNREDPKYVIMGIADLKLMNLAVKRQIAKIIIHPDYKANFAYNDIALLYLNESVPISSVVRPACLWQNLDFGEEYARALGWGDTEYFGVRSDKLMQVTVEVVQNNKCQKYFPYKGKTPVGIVDSQICAGEADKDTCQGDSGGPLFYKMMADDGSSQNHLIGITSFGKGCATSIPGAYTRVSYYIDWIEEIVWLRQ